MLSVWVFYDGVGLDEFSFLSGCFFLGVSFKYWCLVTFNKASMSKCNPCLFQPCLWNLTQLRVDQESIRLGRRRVLDLSPRWPAIFHTQQRHHTSVMEGVIRLCYSALAKGAVTLPIGYFVDEGVAFEMVKIAIVVAKTLKRSPRCIESMMRNRRH